MPVVNETIHADRRRHRRYLIDLGLRFRRIAGKRCVSDGAGRLANISSGGLLFETADNLPAGSRLEIKVEWPYCHDTGQRLELRVVGRVVRAKEGRVGVRMMRHELQPVYPNLAGQVAAAAQALQN